MPPDVVVRPSGVWNSRAPFHNFLQEHRHHNRTYHLLTAVILRVKYEAEKRDSQDRRLRRFLKTRKIGLIAERAVMGYELSYPRAADGRREEATVARVSEALEGALYDVRQGVIVDYVSSFETFVRCWSLNYLLAILEAGNTWTVDERRLATMLSPLHSARPRAGQARIFECLPSIVAGLRKLPHVAQGANADTPVDEAVTPELGIYQSISFWREFRNLVVHSGNVISTEFVRRNSVTFDLLRKPYGYIGPLRVGSKLVLFDTAFRALVTVHYRAALWLNEALFTLSKGRRGHVLAPDPPCDSVPPMAVPQPLLITGDHGPSYLFWAQLSGSDTHSQVSLDSPA